jgi:hypothetical protein
MIGQPCSERFSLLSAYSQPYKQTTADEIVGFIAALNKVTFLKIISDLISVCYNTKMRVVEQQWWA